jgi:hypothetical protein
MLRVTFWHSDKPRERVLSDAFCQGVAAAGDFCEQRSLQPEIDVADCDIACMVGVKSAELWQAHVQQGRHVIMFDKGYTRHAKPGAVKIWEYWRVAVDAHQPTRFVAANLDKLPDDRAFPLQIVLQGWRKNGTKILIAGSSEKYHQFHKLSHPTRWAEKVVARIRELTWREIVYRPKPSWREATPIRGTTFSGADQTIEQALADCWAVVTHGSNACFESVICGVPVIVLGEAIAKPISSTALEDLADPWLCTFKERHGWINAIAYTQWTEAEFASGLAWQTIRGQIHG